MSQAFFVIARSPPASPERARARDGGQAEGDAAISLFPIYYEIASVVSLPRNDIMKQSLEGGGGGGNGGYGGRQKLSQGNAQNYIDVKI